MRYLTLKTLKTRTVSNRTPLDFSYSTQIVEIVGNAINLPDRGAQGFNLETMRKAFRVMDAVENVEFGNVVKLEDADWEFLKQRVSQFQWPWADRAFETFCTDIEGAPKVAPDDLPLDSVEEEKADAVALKN